MASSKVADTTPVESGKPSMASMIQAALKAESIANQQTEAAREADRMARTARDEARAAWDALYAELLQLKMDNRESQAFKESKLGKLLESAR